MGKAKLSSMTIHDLPVSERPRERMQQLGADALSAQEILALILGRAISGESVMITAQRLLSQFGDLKGIADAFESVRSQRLVRFLGFTGLGDTEALHLVVESGRFDVVQVYYNLLNPSAGTDVLGGFAGQDFRKLISLAAGKDMGVVVIRVMAGGALGGPAARAGHASPTIGGALVSGSPYDGDMARGTKLDFLLTGDVTSLPQAAVRFALMHRGVSTVLVGFSDEKQIDEAVGCSGKGPIPDSAVEGLKAVWSSDFGSKR